MGGSRLMAHYGDDGDRRIGYGGYGHPYHHGHLGGYGYDDHGMQHDDHDDEAIADPKHPGNADYEPHSLGHKVPANPGITTTMAMTTSMAMDTTAAPMVTAAVAMATTDITPGEDHDTYNASF